jgi:hypothetical protein
MLVIKPFGHAPQVARSRPATASAETEGGALARCRRAYLDDMVSYKYVRYAGKVRSCRIGS